MSLCFLSGESSSHRAEIPLSFKFGAVAVLSVAMVLSGGARAASDGEKVVRREVAVSVIGLSRPRFPIEEASIAKVIDYWVRAMDREVGNRPDLIALPECCDTIPTPSAAEKARWIRMRGTKVLEAIQAYAAEHHCYIVYAAHRERDDGRFANSSTLIDRSGKVAAVYDKVFPTVGEMESAEFPVVPGREAVVAETDFGRVGFVICFDLNFSELKEMYRAKHPDVLVFSSFFDGDFRQREWALDCQSHFISATCSESLPGRVIDPSGGELRHECYYMPTFTAMINTNCRVMHLDFNREKFAQVIRRYGRRVTIRNPGEVGSVTLVSNDPSLPVDEVMRAFELEPLSAYFERSRDVRAKALGGKSER